MRQRQGYADALRAEGWETIEVPPADDCPDPVFVEDTVGLRVVAVDISEFERLEGCVTCLSVNPRGWPRHGASHGRARRTSVGCLR